MKFVKIDKEKFKPTKNSVKELIFLAYLSFIYVQKLCQQWEQLVMAI